MGIDGSVRAARRHACFDPSTHPSIHRHQTHPQDSKVRGKVRGATGHVELETAMKYDVYVVLRYVLRGILSEMWKARKLEIPGCRKSNQGYTDVPKSCEIDDVCLTFAVDVEMWSWTSTRVHTRTGTSTRRSIWSVCEKAAAQLVTSPPPPTLSLTLTAISVHAFGISSTCFCPSVLRPRFICSANKQKMRVKPNF